MNTKQLLKAYSKSKTVIFAILLSAFGFLQTQLDTIRVLIDDPKNFAMFCLFVSSIITALRHLTTTSLIDKALSSESVEKSNEERDSEEK